MVYCWKCGKNNENESDYCDSCGTDLFHVSVKEIVSKSIIKDPPLLSRLRDFRIDRTNIGPILMILGGSVLWLLNFLIIFDNSFLPNEVQPYIVVVYSIIFIGILVALAKKEEQRNLLILALGILIVNALYTQTYFTDPLYGIRDYIYPIGMSSTGLIILRYLMRYSENKNILFASGGIIIIFSGFILLPWGLQDLSIVTFAFSVILGLIMIGGGIKYLDSLKSERKTHKKK